MPVLSDLELTWERIHWGGAWLNWIVKGAHAASGVPESEFSPTAGHRKRGLPWRLNVGWQGEPVGEEIVFWGAKVVLCNY